MATDHPPAGGRAEADKQVLVLHQFPPICIDPPGSLSGSPFSAKVEVFCRLFNIPISIESGMNAHATTKKMPWLEYRSGPGAPRTVADSSAIIAELTRSFNVPCSLSGADAATAHLLQRAVEEHMYWTMVRCRWLSAASPAFLAKHYFKSTQLFASFVIWAAGQRANVWAQGTGRFTEAEVVARLEADCAAISQVLEGRGEGRFLFNSATPNAIDACVFAHLDAMLREWEGNWARTPQTLTPAITAYLGDMRKKLGLPAPAV